MRRMPSNYQFLKRGLPFFSIVGGGVFTLYFFQKVRYEFRQTQRKNEEVENFKNEMESQGYVVNRNITTEDIFVEMTSKDNDNWENIRGPRPEEDNAEYLRAKERQTRKAQERRAAAKAARERQRQEMVALGLVADPNPPRS